MGMKFGAQTSLTKIRTWDNCHSDICTCNICPGDNCPHPEYFLTEYFLAQNFFRPKIFLGPDFFSRANNFFLSKKISDTNVFKINKGLTLFPSTRNYQNF